MSDKATADAVEGSAANPEFQEVAMGDVLAMRSDPIADVCKDAYEGEGVFGSGGWVTIPRAVSRTLIPGEDFEQFADMPPTGKPTTSIDLERLDLVRRVELGRQRVDVLVAPAVLVVAQRAQADHWTVGELIKAVADIAEEYRPRTERLAKIANPEEE
jgi:hypothetical protein